MQGEVKERWMRLCEQATVEQDPDRLLALVNEINEILEAKERSLRIIPPKEAPAAQPELSQMDKERWSKLSEIAENEEDSSKLMELFEQMLDMLDQRYKSLTKPSNSSI